MYFSGSKRCEDGFPQRKIFRTVRGGREAELREGRSGQTFFYLFHFSWEVGPRCRNFFFFRPSNCGSISRAVTRNVTFLLLADQRWGLNNKAPTFELPGFNRPRLPIAIWSSLRNSEPAAVQIIRGTHLRRYVLLTPYLSVSGKGHTTLRCLRPNLHSSRVKSPRSHQPSTALTMMTPKPSRRLRMPSSGNNGSVR